MTTRTPTEQLPVPEAGSPEAMALENFAAFAPEFAAQQQAFLEHEATHAPRRRREPLAESHEWLMDTRYT